VAKQPSAGRTLREKLKFQAITHRLMMTAYYTKCKLSNQRVEEAIKEFFSHHFDDFIPKHTMWELLYDPPEISAMTLNRTRVKLQNLSKSKISIDEPE